MFFKSVARGLKTMVLNIVLNLFALFLVTSIGLITQSCIIANMWLF